MDKKEKKKKDGRGGARKGAGRKKGVGLKYGEPTVTFSTSIPVSKKEYIIGIVDKEKMKWVVDNTNTNTNNLTQNETTH